MRSYRSGLAEFAEAEKVIERQHGQEALAVRANELGEVDRLWLTAVRIESAASARSLLEAMRKLQLAYGAVEDAVQQPLSRAAFEVSPTSPLGLAGKENKP